MTTKAQARADAAQRKCEELAAEVDRLDKELLLWAVHAQRANGFTYTLADPTAMLLVQPDGFGHWAVFLNSHQYGGAWNGTDFGPLDADYTDLYRWELAQALTIVDRLVADDAAAVDRWRTHREETRAGAADSGMAVAS